MKFLSLLLCPMLALNPIWAQSNSAGPVESDLDGPLNVHVVEDPGPTQTQATSAKGYVVRVTTPSGAPVVGAAVALRLPEEGPTGRFSNGLRAWVTYSDTDGIARFPVIQWGENAGQVEVRVTAAKGSSHAGLMIPLQIEPAHPPVSVVPAGVERTAVVPKPATPPQPEVKLPTPQPGTISKPLADAVPLDLAAADVSKSGASAPTSTPHSLTPNPPAKDADSAEPAVSITNSPTGAAGSHGSHKMVWILLAVGAGAGVGAILAVKGHGGSSNSGSSTGVSIGAPSVTVGH